jgi:hypothetical protein
MSAGLTLKQHLAQQGLLQRFEERAIRWAEEAQIRWIELEGELWTLVSELERKKGVEPGDFTKHAKPEANHKGSAFMRSLPQPSSVCCRCPVSARRPSLQRSTLKAVTPCPAAVLAPRLASLPWFASKCPSGR